MSDISAHPHTGEAIRNLSMEGRMTVCNMSIEAGARAGMIAPDATTFTYLKDRENTPKGADWDTAVAEWSQLPTDPGTKFDILVEIDAAAIAPYVSWGTSPGQVAPITATVPSPGDYSNETDQRTITRALEYMGLTAGTPLNGVPIERVFIGSCTNGRIEDLRAAADVAKGRKVSSSVHAMVVPGSVLVKYQAEKEGLDVIFREAGFDVVSSEHLEPNNPLNPIQFVFRAR